MWGSCGVIILGSDPTRSNHYLIYFVVLLFCRYLFVLGIQSDPMDVLPKLSAILNPGVFRLPCTRVLLAIFDLYTILAICDFVPRL